MRQRWKNPNLVQRWSNNSNTQSNFWLQQTQAVTTSPCQAAAAKQTEWLSAVQASQKLWHDRLNAIDATAWKARVAAVGASAYSNGVTKKTTGYQNYVTKLPAAMQAVEAALTANKRGNLQANMDRAKAVAVALKQAFGKPVI